jgi:hypothetical protein
MNKAKTAALRAEAALRAKALQALRAKERATSKAKAKSKGAAARRRAAGLPAFGDISKIPKWASPKASPHPQLKNHFSYIKVP